jgi:hypothetical protein
VKSFRYMLAGLLALCSFAFVAAAPASAQPPGYSLSHSTHVGDWLTPLLATLADFAVVPATPTADEPELHQLSGTGPVASIYRLSYLTDAANFHTYHRRC